MTSLNTIPIFNLILALIPVMVVLFIMYSWSMRIYKAIYSVARMVAQLVLVGFVLVYIFAADNAWLVTGVLSIMLIAASWISLGPLLNKNRQLYLVSLVAISVGGVTTLAFVTQLVLELDPWFSPQHVIPLAGMIFANSLNSISLAAERLESELKHNTLFDTCRHKAFNAALIPQVNALFAAGLVGLPGMMTGQILSGVSPLIAVRYQIMVMCMIFGSAGISAACYLVLYRRNMAMDQIN